MPISLGFFKNMAAETRRKPINCLAMINDVQKLPILRFDKVNIQQCLDFSRSLVYLLSATFPMVLETNADLHR